MVFLMTHVIYVQNISDDEMTSTVSLLSSQIQTGSLPEVCDFLFFNIMTVIRANTYSIGSFNPSNHQQCYKVISSHFTDEEIGAEG